MKKILCALLGLILTLPVFAACPSGQVEQTYTSATGTVTQNGTPTPTNPIEPIFYQQGDMVLRKVGDIADSYDASTGKITRRVGVKVFNGDEEWNTYTTGAQRGYYIGVAANIGIKEGVSLQNQGILSSHFNYYKWTDNTTAMPTNSIGLNINASSGSTTNGNMTIKPDMSAFPTIETWKTWLSQNPITVYYQLATETTENWNETTYCITPIKIATTAYNSARFSPVVTELNDTIATIRSVVTNTINQTKAIADLQATKQTRPDETCPAGKKCLLVEDDAGQPHWYEIIENAYGLPSGYTGLEYIQSTGTQYIDTGITGSTNAIIDMQGTPRTDDTIVFMLAPIDATAFQNGFGQYQSTMTGSFDIATRRVYNVSYTSSSVTVNDVNVSTRYIANNVNLALFGSTASNRKIKDAKLYSAKIYNNDTLLRNFVPAKNASGVIGVYDLVSGQFFTNQGTGTFVAGPVVQ